MNNKKIKKKYSPVRLSIFITLIVVFLSITIINAYEIAIKMREKIDFPIKYQEIVEKYASEYNVKQELIYSVIRCESSFDPNAESEIGARGLMQITEETFEWIKTKLPEDNATYDDIFDPEINIKYGVKFLSLLINEFNNLTNVMCAYHAGWGNTKKWISDEKYSTNGIIDNIPFSDTNYYVDRVLTSIEKYKEILYEP